RLNASVFGLKNIREATLYPRDRNHVAPERARSLAAASMDAGTVRVIVITGSMGSGKTTILSEASDLLAARGIPHAAIDLDVLAIVCLPAGSGDDTIAWRNLACVWQNYARAGVRTLLVAHAIEDPRDLDRLREAVPGAQIVVCRLTAAIATMQNR